MQGVHKKLVQQYQCFKLFYHEKLVTRALLCKVMC